MNNKGLWLLVEGDDDERLIKHIENELINGRYLGIQFYQYAQKPQKEIVSFIRTLNKMGADYIFLRDLDKEICVTRRKEKIIERFQDIEVNKILIVKRAIEAWYLAGLDDLSCKTLGINVFQSTDEIGKPDLLLAVPNRWKSRIDFLQEILKKYSIQVAKTKNSSFEHFLVKHFS